MDSGTTESNDENEDKLSNGFEVIDSQTEEDKEIRPEATHHETNGTSDFVVENEEDMKQENNDEAYGENEACTTGTESDAERSRGMDDTFLTSDKENTASDIGRHYDADDSCLSGTLDESTVECSEIKKEESESNEYEVPTQKYEETEDVEGNSGNAPGEDESIIRGARDGDVVGEVDGTKCDGEEIVTSIVASQQESGSNFDQQEFRANSLVSETRMLTAVTEETEEELLELDGKFSADIHMNKSHSMEELKAMKMIEERMHRSAELVYAPKDVVLRKGILKKDRPLSDNYENIKMVARESRINRLCRQSESDDSATSLDKRKSRSLDLLLVDDENRKSPSLTSSQLSLSDIHGSIESIDRLEPSNMQLYRSKSDGSRSLDHRASLNDIASVDRDDFNDPPPMIKKKRSRFSFKRKSKSTTALDKKGDVIKDAGR